MACGPYSLKGEVHLWEPKNLTESAKIAIDVEERIKDSSFCVQHVQQFYDKQFLVRNGRNDLHCSQIVQYSMYPWN